jgi:hypothetical protein
MVQHESRPMGAGVELSGLLEMVAAVSLRIAAYQKTLEAGIDLGVSGTLKSGHVWLAHKSTRPGETYRVTMFDPKTRDGFGSPIGHVAFPSLREMSSYLVGIAADDCVVSNPELPENAI